ncbi:hypothetical protein JW905_18130, partial [bacterium]|nr:hypothetical protein [candidate division CSSED10-310 bacterium]
MKVGTLLIALALVIVSGSAVESASLSFGFRYWSSSWSIDNQLMENPGDTAPGGFSTPAFLDAIDSIDVSGSGLFGGALSIGFSKRFSLSATFMTGNFDFEIENTARYEFEEGSEYGYYETDFDITQSATRYDLDIALQYKFSSYITAYIGYKTMDYTFDKQDVIRSTRWVLPNGQVKYSFDAETQIDEYTVGYHGPGIGIMGFYLIPTTSFIYYGTVGALPYLMTSGDIAERLADDDTGWAANAEIGVGFTSPAIPLIPTLGYRYQT